MEEWTRIVFSPTRRFRILEIGSQMFPSLGILNVDFHAKRGGGTRTLPVGCTKVSNFVGVSIVETFQVKQSVLPLDRFFSLIRNVQSIGHVQPFLNRGRPLGRGPQGQNPYGIGCRVVEFLQMIMLGKKIVLPSGFSIQLCVDPLIATTTISNRSHRPVPQGSSRVQIFLELFTQEFTTVTRIFNRL